MAKQSTGERRVVRDPAPTPYEPVTTAATPQPGAGRADTPTSASTPEPTACRPDALVFRPLMLLPDIQQDPIPLPRHQAEAWQIKDTQRRAEATTLTAPGT